MKILAIETSCDETSAAIVENKGEKINVLSNITATSINIHATTGGIIPENAARMQVKYILPVIIKALLDSGESNKNFIKKQNFSHNLYIGQSNNHSYSKVILNKANHILKNSIDAIAVTYGPGLVGSLLVGVETAKTLSYIFNKPLIPVNHLLAHLYANFIFSQTNPCSPNPKSFPFIGLVVSGGHTDLLLFKSHGKYKWLGGTRDDAAGEALDKIGRLLNLPYPAGPEIERRANLVIRPSVKFKSPILNENNFDFSFSGLKTEALRFVQKNKILTDDLKNEVCFAVQKAIFDVIIRKTLKAAEQLQVRTVLIGGGVSANETLKSQLKLDAERYSLKLNIFSPEKIYSTDNAAMIGAYALINSKKTGWDKVKANPELYFA